MKDADLSKLTRTRAQLKASATRVNSTQPLHTLVPVNDKGNVSVRNARVTWIERKRPHDEAPAPYAQDWRTAKTYVPGDGDYVYHLRANSDHSYLKSFGDRT